MANILCTGAAGYVGSVVVDELIKRGHRVVVLDNFSRGHYLAVNGFANLVIVDLTDKRKLRQIFGEYLFDMVIHLAAATTVEQSMTNPQLFFDNNIVGGLNLLNTMLEFGVKKIIFSSSATVYGDTEGKPVKETDRLNPISAYGETKLMFENILKWYGIAYGLKHISFRYFNVAGATKLRGQDHNPETSLIPCVLQALLNKNLGCRHSRRAARR